MRTGAEHQLIREQAAAARAAAWRAVRGLRVGVLAAMHPIVMLRYHPVGTVAVLALLAASAARGVSELRAGHWPQQVASRVMRRIRGMVLGAVVTRLLWHSGPSGDAIGEAQAYSGDVSA